MKITFLLLSIERSGGVRVTTEIANQLSDLGHDCVILVPVQNSFPFEFRSNIEIIRINKNRSKSKFGIIRTIFDMAIAIPCDTEGIVSSYYLTAYSAIIAKIFRPSIKLFYIIQGFEPNYFRPEKGRTQWFSYILAKISYKLPFKRSVISKWLANIFDKNGYKNIPVINNGIDSDLFKPLGIRSVLPEHKIMTVSNKRVNRGFFDFCEAINILWEERKDFSVLIVGFDRSVVKGLNAPYNFITPKDDDELINVYNESSIYVSCSHEEGFGLTPLEAMSCGIPVVCTDSGGIRDYAVDGINCLIVAPKDIKEISASMSTLLSDDKLRAVFVDRGRETALKFDWKNIGKQYDSFMQEN